MTDLTEADLKSALPDVSTPRRLRALRSGVVIRRDLWGIPHIKAREEYDLFLAQGFATAQDRLFQMDFDRLRALGRSAEYLGPKALEQDRYMTRRQLERISKLDYALASTAARASMDAYADGVNAFIETTRTLPVEYKLLGLTPEPWEPWHCIAVYKVRNTAEGSFQGKLWLARLAMQIGPERAAKLSPGYPPESLLTVPPGERFRGPVLDAVDELRAVVDSCSMLSDTNGGSNGWAISGHRTASGLPLVAGDSHRGLEAPNVYYQVHLLGADFAVLGYSIPGFPMALHFCHNEYIGWGMTAAGTDTQDLFVERFRNSWGQLEYLYKEEWLRARTSLETLRPRGAAPEQVEVVETHHGPVIAGDPHRGAAIALADPGSKDATPWIDAAYRAMKARSADEFESTLEGWTDRVNNFVYADIHGNFGYTLRGRIPIRGSENGWGPIAGWTGAHEWTGYVSAEELPRARNPSTGWVVSCNQRIVDDNYPYYLTHFGSTPYRAERIATRIAQIGSNATVEHMIDIHADAISIPAQSLQKALRANGLSVTAADAAHFLLKWDCTLKTDSAEAALYSTTFEKLAERLIAFHYSGLSQQLLHSFDAGADEHWRRHLKSAIVTALEKDDMSWLPKGQSWSSLLSVSLEEAVAQLKSRFGTERAKWRWGALHRSAQQHPLAALFPEAAALLNPPHIETAGDGDTPLLSGFKIGADFVTTVGSVNRYVHDPSNWSNGGWVVPLGASGHPGSPHYADQQEIWARVGTIRQLWEWDEIGQHTESEQELIAEIP